MTHVHEWLDCSYCKVCKLCGLTLQTLQLDTFCLSSAPLYRGYNRRARFCLKVKKLVGLHNGPNYTEPVWEYLNAQRLLLNTPFDVRTSLRSSRLKNKHYDSMRIFCDTFTDYRVDVDILLLQRQLLDEFDRLYAKWSRDTIHSFFSYSWILRIFLDKLKSPLICYLKPPTCKRRHAKYLLQLTKLNV